MTVPAKFPLTQLEQRRVLEGNPMPLIRDTQPALELGQHVIVQMSKERRHCDKDGTVFVMPPKPVVWITVTKVTRRRIGGWAVRYDISDARDKALMLAPGSGYTTDAAKALDRLEVPLSEKDRLRLATESKATHAERNERNRELRQRQERAMRARLRDALDGLDPVGQQALLAALAREIEKARRREAA